MTAVTFLCSSHTMIIHFLRTFLGMIVLKQKSSESCLLQFRLVITNRICGGKSWLFQEATACSYKQRTFGYFEPYRQNLLFFMMFILPLECSWRQYFNHGRDTNFTHQSFIARTILAVDTYRFLNFLQHHIWCYKSNDKAEDYQSDSCQK